MRMFLAVLATGLATSAAAEDLALTFGTQFNARYDTDPDFAHADNTVEASLEASYGGVLFGIGLETVPDDEEDSVEAEVSLGYETDLTDDVEVSLVYTRTVLDGSGFDSQDVTLGLTAEITETLSGGLALIHDPDADSTDAELELGLTPHERWSFGLLLGASNADDTTYQEVSVAYALHDGVALEALYEDGSDETGQLTLSLVFEVGLLGD